jgi:hypothetical protein
MGRSRGLWQLFACLFLQPLSEDRFGFTNVLYFAPRMLGWEHKAGCGRGFLATCLVLFFAFSSIAPLAASAFDSPSGNLSCCKTKGIRCCHRRVHGTPDSGPAIGAAPCADCGAATLGAVNAMGHAVIRLAVSASVIRVAGTVASSTILTPSRLSAHNLRQRPPPQNRLA